MLNDHQAIDANQRLRHKFIISSSVVIKIIYHITVFMHFY